MGLTFWKRLGERRISERVPAQMPVAVQVVDGRADRALTSEQEAHLVNISASGCCLALSTLFINGLHLHRCLAEPDALAVLVILPVDGSRVHMQKGRVRWINREFNDSRMCFRVGIQFYESDLPKGWRDWLKNQ